MRRCAYDALSVAGSCKGSGQFIETIVVAKFPLVYILPLCMLDDAENILNSL